MSDIPSIIFGPLQEDIVIVFGESIGMLIGHLIIIAIISSIVVVFQNRRHIYEKSGFDKNTAIDIFSLLVLSIIQFIVFTSIFDFSQSASVLLSVIGSLLLRWVMYMVG
tara:strand:+ start:160 stop:486 length:327 start_codon:yes stop_codon:yes gene_type:complete